MRCADCDLELREDVNTYARLTETLDEFGAVIASCSDRLCETCHDLSLYGDDLEVPF